MGFVGEDALLGPATPAAFLAAYFFKAFTFRIRAAFTEALNFIQKQLASKQTVLTLLPRGLAFDLQAGGTMEQHDAGGRLVDILPAVSARADE